MERLVDSIVVHSLELCFFISVRVNEHYCCYFFFFTLILIYMYILFFFPRHNVTNYLHQSADT